MSELFKSAQAKVGKGWSLLKKIVALLSLWGLCYSLVTIGKLRVAFDYDDTLVFSTAAFDKAFKSGAQPFSGGFWTAANTAYDLEDRKILANCMAWTFKLLGFKITILAERQADGGDALKKEWRSLASRFVFAPDPEAKRRALGDGNHVLYFGDSDADISKGRQAGVLTLRVRRSPKSSYKQDYHPGKLGELVIPLSEY